MVIRFIARVGLVILKEPISYDTATCGWLGSTTVDFCWGQLVDFGLATASKIVVLTALNNLAACE
jgi:hypothetical protein